MKLLLSRKSSALIPVLVLLVAAPTALRAQGMDRRSKAISRKSLTPGKLDDIVSDHLSKVVQGTARATITPNDLAALKAIYSAAFRIRTRRLDFIKTVDDYQLLVSSHAAYLDREQAYYTMGNAAAGELKAVKEFDEEWNANAAQLNLRYEMVNFEVTSWQSQAHDVIQPILNKPKLLGMSQGDLQKLKEQLDEHGRHLDVALAALKTAIVASGGDTGTADAKQTQ